MTEMTEEDLSLLRLAARAIGATEYDWETSHTGLFIREGRPVVLHRGEHEYDWNPLDDDGHALRLSAELEIDIRYYAGAVTVSEHLATWSITEDYTTDRLAAARRAIVRAAVAIHSTRTSCDYAPGDWRCREGGYLWYAGDGEGYDPQDCTHICPCCRTADYLEAAKEEAESCSSYSNNGSSGTGLTIWTDSERTALEANRPEAIKALATLGPVEALDGDDIVICNVQPVTE